MQIRGSTPANSVISGQFRCSMSIQRIPMERHTPGTEKLNPKSTTNICSSGRFRMVLPPYVLQNLRDDAPSVFFTPDSQNTFSFNFKQAIYTNS